MAGMLLPEPDDDSTGFWEGCAGGELRVQRCAACGRRRFPPRPMCPACGCLEREWEAVSGRGRIWSFVVAHPPLLPAYAEHAPYNVVVVELAEEPGLRMVGNVVASPEGSIGEVDPSILEIGQEVQVVFAHLEDPDEDGEPVALPRWVLA